MSSCPPSARPCRRGRRYPGEAILRGVKHLERLVFRILVMIMWLAPIGAFGAMAAVVGSTGWSAVVGLEPERVLRGEDPFDETTMLDEPEPPESAKT